MVCLGFISCAKTTDLSPRINELQNQLIELQKSQASLNVRMDELGNSIMVLEETTRLSRMELENLKRSTTSPRITITNRQAEDSRTYPRTQPPVAEENLKPAISGRGGEYVAPPPLLDPSVPVQIKEPISPAEDCRIEPSADLLADAGFAKAWAVHSSERYGLAIYEWSEVKSSVSDESIRFAALYFLAECYYRLKEYQQAVSLYSETARGATGVLYRQCALLKVAMCLEFSGKSAEAIDWYNQVVQNYPGTDVAKLAQGRLSKIR